MYRPLPGKRPLPDLGGFLGGRDRLLVDLSEELSLVGKNTLGRFSGRQQSQRHDERDQRRAGEAAEKREGGVRGARLDVARLAAALGTLVLDAPIGFPVGTEHAQNELALHIVRNAKEARPVCRQEVSQPVSVQAYQPAVAHALQLPVRRTQSHKSLGGYVRAYQLLNVLARSAQAHPRKKRDGGKGGRDLKKLPGSLNNLTISRKSQ